MEWISIFIISVNRMGSLFNKPSKKEPLILQFQVILQSILMYFWSVMVFWVSPFINISPRCSEQLFLMKNLPVNSPFATCPASNGKDRRRRQLAHEHMVHLLPSVRYDKTQPSICNVYVDLREPCKRCLASLGCVNCVRFGCCVYSLQQITWNRELFG